MQEALEKGSFELIENGEPIKYSVLFTFANKQYNKNYVVYTDETLDEDGNINVFTSSYNPQGEFELFAIEDEEEWNMIDDQIDKVFTQYEE